MISQLTDDFPDFLQSLNILISIGDEIINIVTLFKSYGVNEILVSVVTPRHG